VSNDLWAKKLQALKPVFLHEFNQFLQHNKLQPYFKNDMVSTGGKWETVSLKVWGISLQHNQSFFPSLTNWLNEFQNVLSISFNVLAPQSTILPHYGDTNGIYRVHFGLEIPEGLPNCGIKVGTITKPWTENEFVAFNDSYTHSVWNNTDLPRLIMVIDILKTEYLNQKKFICAMVITGLWLQKVAMYLPFLYKLPLIVQKSLVYLFFIPVYIFSLFKVS